jgi:DNA invertase Pin-like site-specific DNA recombinase
MKETKQEKQIFCAIYTRKSTSEGLEQDFTSLDAQRESAESYIASQKSEGWIALPEKYDDGGFTGANTDRPALQKLLSDIQDGKINCVIVYKVDRLSRSLLDFVQLLELFEQNNVTFVSVTQHFNTNTSMGRLTLNILLSFAQFEREIISERTKDKMAAARKKGKWLGGRPILGYDLDRVNRKLIINEKEAELVKKIFNLYINEKSLLTVAKILNDLGCKTKGHITKSGKAMGNVAFKNSNVQQIVKNVLYTGKVSYAGELYPGEHKAIISDETFNKVKEIMAKNRISRESCRNIKNIGLLSKILRCKPCDSVMIYSYTKKGDLKYSYYVCSNAQKRGFASCPTRSVNAQDIENAVIEYLSNKINKPNWDKLNTLEKRNVLISMIRRIDYDITKETLEISLAKEAKTHSFNVNFKRVKHPLQLDPKEEIKNEPKLRQNLALAHQINSLLAEGKAADLKQVAGWLNIDPTRLHQIMNMLLLAPSIQEEIILSDNQRLSKIPEYKLRNVTSQADWQKQRQLWDNLIKA